MGELDIEGLLLSCCFALIGIREEFEPVAVVTMLLEFLFRLLLLFLLQVEVRRGTSMAEGTGARTTDLLFDIHSIR